MSTHYPTLIILIVFMACFIGIAYLSKKGTTSDAPDSSEEYVVGGRQIGTLILLLSMGATYFSTWTLLGAFGSYYRTGVWFSAFMVWTIFHGIFIWLFGSKIWLIGKIHNFITPGQMVEHYYQSRRLRISVAIIGIMALVPVMLIQVSGGAKALDTMTDGTIPYTVGVILMSIIVGFVVLWAGFKGTAWTDTFMGIFFAFILIFTLFYSLYLAGGTDIFKKAMEYKPELLVNKGDPLPMLETWLGLGFGAWVMPHMWQKFYSAKSPLVLGKVGVMTPLWNSWMMALIPLVVAVAAMIPGIIPGINDKNSDTILPLLYATHIPVMGGFVVAGILAAAMSTINSQLLSSASIVAEDIWNTLAKKPLSSTGTKKLTQFVVISLTILILILALTPGGTGYLVPVAALGFGLGLQLVPSALGMLCFKSFSEKGAFWGIIFGVSTIIILSFIHTPIPKTLAGFAVNLILTFIISKMTQPVPRASIDNYHNTFKKLMKDNV